MVGYISELSYGGDEDEDFVEIAIPSGIDVSGYSLVLYSDDGEEEDTVSLGLPVSSSGSMDIYLLDKSSGFSGMESGWAVALVDDTGTVLQFLSFGGGTVTAEEGPAAKYTSVDIGESKTSLETTDGGKSYQPQPVSNPGTIPCYAPGTLIETPEGPRAVEDLQVGELVTTLDHGPQPIRWVRCGDQPMETVEMEAKPVLVAAGALGPGCPAQDLIVSPQHRIFIGGGGQLLNWFKTEGFARRNL